LSQTYYPDSDFEFNFCPHCCGRIRTDGLFSTGKMVFSGKSGTCYDCGKEWHVVREDVDEDNEEE